MPDRLSPYRAKVDETRWGRKINADDAFAKVEVVKAELIAAGEKAEIADFAAKAFVWSGGLPDGGFCAETFEQMQAAGALNRWIGAKSQAEAA